MHAINQANEINPPHSPQFCNPSCLADVYALAVIIDQFILKSLQSSGQSGKYHPRTWDRLSRFILEEMRSFSGAYKYEQNCALSRFYASGGTLLEDPAITKALWKLDEKQIDRIWEVFANKIKGYIESPDNEQNPLKILVKMRACAATLFFYLAFYCSASEVQKALQKTSMEIMKNTLDFSREYVRLSSITR